VKTLAIILQKIEVKRHDAILIMSPAKSFLNLLQDFIKQIHPQRCGTTTKLIEVWFLAQSADRIGENGSGEMYLSQQLDELSARSLEMSLLIDVGSEADNDVMFLLSHNECKDSKKINRTEQTLKNIQ
jgi:hypothetical protein